jgi:hypothetical protein
VKPRLAAAFLLLAASWAGADVYYMTDGDRITGKTLSQASGFYKVDTPYGRVAIPKGRITKIVHDDGREELLGMQPAPPPVERPAPGVRLVLTIAGAAFYQAWDPKEGAPADPSLRLQVSVDEETVASYVDSKTDPEIAGAVVNSFSFAPEDVTLAAGEAASLEKPETRPGHIMLKIDLPAASAGERRLRFTYQANDGSAESPAWRDLVDTLIHVDLKPDTTTIVEIRQDLGRMEFSGSGLFSGMGRKKMKNVDTFRIEAKSI